MNLRSRFPIFLVVFAMVFVAAATPAQAQREFEPLFDKFNVSVQGSWIKLSTEIGLDSETLGIGTTLKFEDDLGLSSSETIPSLAFEWQIAKKHRLAVRWQDITRDSTAQALTEIQWGDELIPIDADITLAFDLTQYFIDYTYYPWVKDKWAAGFGLGIRWMDLYAELHVAGRDPRRGRRLDRPGGAPAVHLLRVSSDVLRQLAFHRRRSAGSPSRSMISAVGIMSAGRPSSTWPASGGALAAPSTSPTSTSM